MPAHEPITIVVPTYNECLNLPVLYAQLGEALAERSFELLVVDDSSTDGTAEVAAGLGPNARVIVREGERGLATAVLRGLREARHDLCVCMDADLSHPPTSVEGLVAAVEAGAVMALGSRYVKGAATVDWGLMRWINSAGATLLARPLTTTSDPMSGFFCVRRSTVPFEVLSPLGYKIALELLVKLGATPVELPITFHDRLHGESKLSLREQIAYLAHLGRLYRYRWPVLTELVLFCGVGTLGLAVDLGVVTTLVEGFGLWFGWARIVGFLMAVSFNFALNDRFTFVGAGKVGPLARYGRFLLTSSGGLAVNYATSMALFTSLSFFEQRYALAAFLGAVAGAAVNFTGARWYAFTSPSKATA